MPAVSKGHNININMLDPTIIPLDTKPTSARRIYNDSHKLQIFFFHHICGPLFSGLIHERKMKIVS